MWLNKRNNKKQYKILNKTLLTGRTPTIQNIISKQMFYNNPQSGGVRYINLFVSAFPSFI